MQGFLHLVKGEDAGDLPEDDRERLEVMGGISEFPHAGQMRHLGLALRIKMPWKRANCRGGGSDMSDTASALSPQELDAFTSKLVMALETVFDPEIPG